MGNILIFFLCEIFILKIKFKKRKAFMFIDTHCHLNMLVQKDSQVPITIEQINLIKTFLIEAEQNNVGSVITIGTDLIDSINSIKIAKEYKTVFASVGIHPSDSKLECKKDFAELKKLIKEKEFNKIVAIGETGLDFFHKPFNFILQQDIFKFQIELALENKLPIIFHVREASEEFLKILDEYKKELNGVVHCFSHSQDFANTVLSWGFYLGLNAPVTYPKNEAFRQIVKLLPIEKILLETDAPFLPPQQFRGKQNKPAYIPIFAQVIADLLQVDIKILEEQTTKNAKKLFGI